VYNGTSGYNEPRTYDDFQTSTYTPAYWASTSGFSSLPGGYGYPSGPYNYYYPSVAYSGVYPSAMYPNDGTNYAISDFLNDGGSPANNILFMEPVTLGAPQQLINPPNYYYWVSEAPGSTEKTTNYANSVSAQCNHIEGFLLEAWANEYSGTDEQIEYKVSPTGPATYSFRQAAPASVPNEAMVAWSLYPNPAENYLIISNAASNGKTTEYEVTDMPGRTVLHGTVQGSSQVIDIGSLAPGTYIMKLYKDDEAGGQALFVKE